MRMKRLILIILCLATVCGVMAVSSVYDKLEAKAERFVQFQEWNSANAMYLLMLESKPNEIKTFARAIVTYGLLGEGERQLSLYEETQKRGMALDSVYNEVRDFAFNIGMPQQYENFLLLVKKSQPWVSRHINTHLLNYYDFRNDAINMVSVGSELLSVTPENIRFLSIVARGYMLMDDFDNSVATYNKILSLDPDNYDSLLSLGNYYFMMWKSVERSRSQMASIKHVARNYLQKAYALCATPFVESMLAEIGD